MARCFCQLLADAVGHQFSMGVVAVFIGRLRVTVVSFPQVMRIQRTSMIAALARLTAAAVVGMLYA